MWSVVLLIVVAVCWFVREYWFYLDMESVRNNIREAERILEDVDFTGTEHDKVPSRKARVMDWLKSAKGLAEKYDKKEYEIES